MSIPGGTFEMRDLFLDPDSIRLLLGRISIIGMRGEIGREH
jgi:hypothetical protein